MGIDNLKSVYGKATPEDMRVALDSYFKYNRLVTAMAAKHGFSPRIGAALFAALSPNNDYHGNLRDAERMLRAAAASESIDSFNVSTYGHNKRKAWAIVQGAEPLDLIVAKKTRSFFLNISNPLDPVPVTVDGHMLNCWRNQRVNLVGLKSSPRDYDEVADGVRKLACDVGLIASQTQGVLWITWRRLHAIHTPAQRELWDADFRAAGLGWKPTVIV